jgi:hypothetical protein
MPGKIEMETTLRQRKYVEAQKKRGDGIGLVFQDAFIRGMRDIGYKNNGWALAELIDNGIQADATTIAIQFGFHAENKSKAKPDALAIVDNGVGMIPEMISYAVRWGGTDRENSREGFGRYGYGLPSACVSIGERYTVYSKIDGGDWHAVTVDIHELAKVASDISATGAMLRPRRAEPPAWVAGDVTGLDPTTLESGTVVVLESLDRLDWKTAEKLDAKLKELFGVIYRHWIPSPKIVVNGVDVTPVDPLFLIEAGRFYDETPIMAQRVDARTFEMETSRGTKGKVAIRAAYLPPTFQTRDLAKKRGQKNLNSRHSIMRDYNGILICRDGRQIDCIQPKFTKFQTYDANVKVEVDFGPELDEFFGITTSKQQIVLDDDMWERLVQAGRLFDVIRDIRNRFNADNDILGAKEKAAGHAETPRASEEAMALTEKFKSKSSSPSDRKKAEGKKNLEQAATRASEKTGKSKNEIVEQLAERAKTRKFEVEFQAIPEGPFYRPVRLGEQKRLIINTQHPFYSKVYDVSPQVASSLEVLLLVLAEGELEAEGDAETFYKSSRAAWSDRLRHALDVLRTDDEMRDKASAVAEAMQMEPVAPPVDSEE